MQEMKAKYYDMSSKVTELTSKVTELTLKNEELEAQVRLSDVGSVYIRWGRTECPDTAEIVHAGYAGGSWFDDPGAAVNYLCLPKIPKWRPLPNKTGIAFVYGGEYEDDFHSSTPINDYEVPCSVCRTNRSSVLMVPASTECFDGWTMEYNGDLAAGYRLHKAASEYVCVDSLPERASELGFNHEGKSFYPVGSKCGVFPCPPYVDQGRLSCAICSK